MIGKNVLENFEKNYLIEIPDRGTVRSLSEIYSPVTLRFFAKNVSDFALVGEICRVCSA